ncbi:hypothetical protein MIND_00967800 [Mycena indigotica]|uniref:Uncharacterized protein n=1 Tax=Mycena indigotica TaxID=2126181 RepID=A0A8H6VX57_9AGAR|nr:uncharacterized protein MIND_00967800 [Mycena indigotica]KAF7297344.1 hypothetical protein MIND_00967800 [Mycena indigotica]
MIHTITFILVTAAAAQAASSSNPYIPTDISSGCSSFLSSLNTDTDLASCTTSLISASSSFGPGGNYSNGASKAAVSSALSSICSSATASACPQSLITGKLASFYTSCGAELTSSPSAGVKIIYDTFYSLLPLLSSVCAKDDSGDWCVLASNATTDAKLAPAVNIASVSRRAESGSQTAYMPNAKTINDNNLLFLLLKGSLPKAQLCTTCTRNVLTNYISFEGSTNYAPGIAQSSLMSGQSELYQGVVATCGADFLTSAVKAAGGLGQGSSKGQSGALSLRAGGLFASLGALGVAVFML